MTRRPASLAAYGLASRLLTPLAPHVLAARAKGGKEDEERLGERLGRPSRARPDGPLVWLHGVSVGESVSLLPLIERLSAERPDLGLLVTSGTRTSAEMLDRRLPTGVIHQYAPVDTPASVDRFLRHWRPDLGLFAESELWPNLILRARAGGARLALVSARITERSARAWSRWPAAAKAMLEAFELILAQDAASETRLAALGGRVAGRLNLKRVGAPLTADPAELAALKAAIGERAVVAAISTHPGEEAAIAGAVQSLPGRPLLIVAPRHPVRGGEIAGQLGSRALARRSKGEAPGPDADVYLADTLGEIGLVIALADVAVMGGSFGRGIGGHNPLEPARLGVPVLTGPDIANFADLYEELRAAGGAAILAGPADLAGALHALMADTDALRRMGHAALAFSQRQAGEFEAALGLIRPLLPAP